MKFNYVEGKQNRIVVNMTPNEAKQLLEVFKARRESVNIHEHKFSLGLKSYFDLYETEFHPCEFIGDLGSEE